MRKPFWTRTYFNGKQEFRLDRAFINEYIMGVNRIIADNEKAFHDYKKRALFPRVSDRSQAFLQAKSE